jgi:triosephosphate isomerase
MKKIIAGNWKMNFGADDAAALAGELKEKLGSFDCKVLVCVPFTAISLVKNTLEGTNIEVGAQNISWADSGAFTGEISPSMLSYAGATYAIVGHSERRAYFGETDTSVNMRAKKAIEKGITPIICVGETLQDRESGNTENLLTIQLEGAFDGFSSSEVQKVIVAYEPVWAIGTGVTATAEQADQTIGFIREWLKKRFKYSPQILYGGSMKAANAKELLSKNIDGGLIGGAALNADEFAEIVKIGSELSK